MGCKYAPGGFPVYLSDYGENAFGHRFEAQHFLLSDWTASHCNFVQKLANYGSLAYRVEEVVDKDFSLNIHRLDSREFRLSVCQNFFVERIES